MYTFFGQHKLNKTKYRNKLYVSQATSVSRGHTKVMTWDGWDIFAVTKVTQPTFRLTASWAQVCSRIYVSCFQT